MLLSLPLSTIIKLCAFTVMLACGQVLFKMAALHGKTIDSFSSVIALFTNLWFWLAMILYGAATLLWIMILQKTPLTMAYPFMALGFIIVPFLSWILFHETLTPQYFIAMSLIVAGIVVLGWGGAGA